MTPRERVSDERLAELDVMAAHGEDDFLTPAEVRALVAMVRDARRDRDEAREETKGWHADAKTAWARRNADRDAMEEREAAWCPEDVPFDEHIRALRARLARIEAWAARARDRLETVSVWAPKIDSDADGLLADFPDPTPGRDAPATSEGPGDYTAAIVSPGVPPSGEDTEVGRTSRPDAGAGSAADAAADRLRARSTMARQCHSREMESYNVADVDMVLYDRERLAEALAGKIGPDWREALPYETEIELRGTLDAARDEAARAQEILERPSIADRCPSCGARSLFVGADGRLTCRVIGCKASVGTEIERLRARLARIEAWAARARDALVECASYRHRRELPPAPIMGKVLAVYPTPGRDAPAPPKCDTCYGSGQDVVPLVGYTVCPDCGGTGDAPATSEAPMGEWIIRRDSNADNAGSSPARGTNEAGDDIAAPDQGRAAAGSQPAATVPGPTEGDAVSDQPREAVPDENAATVATGAVNFSAPASGAGVSGVAADAAADRLRQRILAIEYGGHHELNVDDIRTVLDDRDATNRHCDELLEHRDVLWAERDAARDEAARLVETIERRIAEARALEQSAAAANDIRSFHVWSNVTSTLTLVLAEMRVAPASAAEDEARRLRATLHILLINSVAAAGSYTLTIPQLEHAHDLARRALGLDAPASAAPQERPE